MKLLKLAIVAFCMIFLLLNTFADTVTPITKYTIVNQPKEISIIETAFSDPIKISTRPAFAKIKPEVQSIIQGEKGQGKGKKNEKENVTVLLKITDERALDFLDDDINAARVAP